MSVETVLDKVAEGRVVHRMKEPQMRPRTVVFGNLGPAPGAQSGPREWTTIKEDGMRYGAPAGKRAESGRRSGASGGTDHERWKDWQCP
jgi:hypothetical protein